MERVAYKQQIYFSQLWRLRSPKLRLSVLWELTSWFINGSFLDVSSHGGKASRALWGLFYNGTNCLYEGTSLVT